MKITAALPYGLTEDEETMLLERQEIDAVNGEIARVTAGMDPRDQNAINLARKERLKIVEPLASRLLTRVTLRLVTQAAGIRFGDAMGKTDRQAWKRVRTMLEAETDVITASPEDAKWLADLVGHSTVQERAFAARAPFVNTPLWAEELDAEMDRVREKLKNPDAEVVVAAPSSGPSNNEAAAVLSAVGIAATAEQPGP